MRRIVLVVLLAAIGGGQARAAVVPVAMGASACDTVSFSSPMPLPTVTPGGAYVTATGDYNRDGRLDLVIPELGGISYVLLGNGDGTFRLGNSFAQVGAVAASGDLNRDGRPDVIGFGLGSASGAAWLGNGDGTFQPARPILLGAAADALSVGDINQDGRPDLVVATHDPVTFAGMLSVLLGNGDGTFQPARHVPLGTEAGTGGPAIALDVALGDFNGDGRADVVTANFLTTVSVLLGNGDGTFGTPVTYLAIPAGGDGSPYAVAAADFNGDGRLDLATSNRKGFTASVLLGNGDGTFGAPRQFPGAAGQGTDIVAADFNGDGKSDLATSGATGIVLLAGKGNGTFEPPLQITDLYMTHPLVAADLNGDGRPDLVHAGAVLLNGCGPHSLALDGTGYAEAAHAPELNLTGDWTVETWFKDETPGGYDHDYQQLVIKGDPNRDGEAPYFLTLGYKRLLAGVRSRWANAAVAYTFGTSLAPGTWHHAAATLQVSSRTLTLYLDGTAVAQDVLDRVSTGNSLPVDLGRAGTSGKYFRGKLDGVRIWNVVRSAGDIAASYRTPLASTPPGLVAYWRFDESGGTTAFDTAGTPHPQNATLAGGATFAPDVHA